MRLTFATSNLRHTCTHSHMYIFIHTFTHGLHGLHMDCLTRHHRHHSLSYHVFFLLSQNLAVQYGAHNVNQSMGKGGQQEGQQFSAGVARGVDKQRIDDSTDSDDSGWDD